MEKFDSAKIIIDWKAISVEFAILLIIIVLLDIYLAINNTRIIQSYLNSNESVSKKRVLRAIKISKIRSRSKITKYNYNYLVYIFACMELKDHNEQGFLQAFNMCRPPETANELKQFSLCIYYLSKSDESAANICYQSFQQCEHHDRKLQTILRWFFESDTVSTDVLLYEVEQFKNDAMKNLIKSVPTYPTDHIM